MNYFLNYPQLQRNFAVPSVVAEKHLKIATPTQLRVLLYVLYSLADDPSDEAVSAATGIPAPDVADALAYWAAAGIFLPKNQPEAVAEPEPEVKKIVRKQAIKPTRQEVAQRGSENENIALLLREGEIRFKRQLTFDEMATLVWIFDSLGMPTSLILMLIEYAESENKLNIRFIERTAVSWSENGIDTIEAADAFIRDIYERRTSWRLVCAAFGIEARQPSKNELEKAHLWVKDWGFERELLRAAYDRCVDALAKVDMRYIGRILEKWHKAEYKTLAEIEAAEGERKKANQSQENSMVTYDIEELERRLNSD